MLSCMRADTLQHSLFLHDPVSLSAIPPSPTVACLQAGHGLLKPQIMLIPIIRSFSGGRGRDTTPLPVSAYPGLAGLEPGVRRGSALQRARRGTQPALRLSARLSPAVRRRDAEGLIALIDTFPPHPTLGRPSLILPLIFLLLPGRTRGAVQPSFLPQGWGRSGETQGLELAGFRSTAGIPRVMVLYVLIFLNVRASGVDFLSCVLFQGSAKMFCGSTPG